MNTHPTREQSEIAILCKQVNRLTDRLKSANNEVNLLVELIEQHKRDLYWHKHYQLPQPVETYNRQLTEAVKQITGD